MMWIKPKLKRCSCGGVPVLRAVGDWKQYWIYRCNSCGKEPANIGDARVTERSARLVWNRRANENAEES